MLKPAYAVPALIIAMFLTCAPPAHAQTPGKVDLEAAEPIAELLGAPVFAADGLQVGEVADIRVDEEGQPARLRMKTGVTLGIGTRTVDVPRGAFIVLRGAVVLELPLEAVQSLSEPTDFVEEK